MTNADIERGIEKMNEMLSNERSNIQVRHLHAILSAMKSPDPCYKHAPDPECPFCNPEPSSVSEFDQAKHLVEAYENCEPTPTPEINKKIVYEQWINGAFVYSDSPICIDYERSSINNTSTQQITEKPSVEKCECKFFTADEEGHPHCDECGAYAYGKKPVEKCETITISRKVCQRYIDYCEAKDATEAIHNMNARVELINELKLALSKEQKTGAC